MSAADPGNESPPATDGAADRCSKTQVRQAGKVIRSRTITPGELAILLADGHIIDAGFSAAHQAVVRELPVLIAMGTEILASFIVPFILKTHGNSVVGIGPNFLD